MAVLEPPTGTGVLSENMLTPPWWDWVTQTSTSTNANDVHKISDGTDHTFINQDIKTTASPSFSSLFISSIKSGATQGAAGAAINELWKTASHATLPDNVLMIGI